MRWKIARWKSFVLSRDWVGRKDGCTFWNLLSWAEPEIRTEIFEKIIHCTKFRKARRVNLGTCGHLFHIPGQLHRTTDL